MLASLKLKPLFYLKFSIRYATGDEASLFSRAHLCVKVAGLQRR